MRLPHQYPYGLLSLLAGLTLSCGGDDIVAVTTGFLAITTVTTGADLDADGYSFNVGEAPARGIGVASTIDDIELDPGNYAVLLDGTAENCGVLGENPRNVRITAGDTSAVTFRVSCVPVQGALRRP